LGNNEEEESITLLELSQITERSVKIDSIQVGVELTGKGRREESTKEIRGD